ncbi:MAG: hypothetical protein A2Y53_03665 [Chloroflexi bacterium RBG_16_47_49]|nr:MAG: hypothetical protein A2Y53_03665 [Chloroflexi bacterium RBG_16_47_49]
MTVTTIILSHYKEREDNLNLMVNKLLQGTVTPGKILIFIDNPDIVFEDERVIIVRSNRPFLPVVRFALGTISGSDFCFFLDDDLSVGPKTLENFVINEIRLPESILGLEGSTLSNTAEPYTKDIPVKRGLHDSPVPVDVVIRTYFVPTQLLTAGLLLQEMYPDLPRKSLDDVFLCLGNKYLNGNSNYVISATGESDLIELPDGGVGQSHSGDHYINRNLVCRELMNIYE